MLKKNQRDLAPLGRRNNVVPGLLEFARENPVEAGLLATSMAPVPVVSDVAGLLGDVTGMVKRPEDRTWANAGLAALGLLPFVPAGMGMLAGKGAKTADLVHLRKAGDLEKAGRGADDILGDGPQMSADLPMDEASRMARADEYFPIDAYHGTTSAGIDEFNPALFGSNTGDKDAKLGVWLSDKPRGTEYFGGFDPDMPTPRAEDYIRQTYGLNQSFRRDRDALRERFLAKDIPRKEYLAMKKDLDDSESLTRAVFFGDAPTPATQAGWAEGSNVLPVRVRGNLKNVPADIYNSNQFSGIARAARAEGYDGVRITGINDLDEAPIPHDQILVFDPKNIRSRFAKFDPKNRNSRDLLAGVAGAGLLGVGARAAIPPEDERGLLY